MSYTLDIALALGSGQTGLTLKAQLVDTTGVAVGSEVTTGFTEIGVGNYLWHYASFPDGHRGGVKFSTTGGTLKAFAAVNPEEAENTDVKTSTRNATTPPTAAAVSDAVWDELTADHQTVGTTGKALSTAVAVGDPLTSAVPDGYASGTAGAALGRLGAGEIETTSPVAESGDVEIIHGDDYFVVDGRALEWVDVSSGWPTLTGATIALSATYSGNTLTKAGTVVTATGAGKKVRVELAAVDTANLGPGGYRYVVVATLSGGHVVTLARGVLSLR